MEFEIMLPYLVIDYLFVHVVMGVVTQEPNPPPSPFYHLFMDEVKRPICSEALSI